METLDELGYEVADAADMGKSDPKVIDGKHFLPQHRERIVLVGFRRDLNIHQGFTLRDVSRFYPEQRPAFWRATGARGGQQIYPDAEALGVPLQLRQKARG